MKTLDLKKDLKYLYASSTKNAEIIEVPRLQFAMIDGAIEKGYEPGNSPAFAEATQALYSISYTLKFMVKKRKANPVDYPVMPLEGLWSIQDENVDVAKKDNWSYTLMILQPDVITKYIFTEGVEQVRRKKGDSPNLSHLRLSHLRLAHFEEGICVQMMH